MYKFYSDKTFFKSIYWTIHKQITAHLAHYWAFKEAEILYVRDLVKIRYSASGF